jgi:hypothetical protein
MKWKGITAPALRREDIEALVSNAAPFLCVPAFLSPDWCREIARRFLKTEPPVYEEFEYDIVKTLQLGLMFTQMPLGHAQYSAVIERNNRTIRGIYQGGEDALSKVKGQMASCGYRVAVPAYEGRALTTDVLRAARGGNCSPLHTDSYGTKPGPLSPRFRHLFSWNLYLETSERGGELCVYRRFPRPGDEKHARPGYAWAYQPSVVAGAPKTVYAPKQGDLVIFNARNYHEVFETGGPTCRTSAHSYIGVDDERGEMTFFI